MRSFRIFCTKYDRIFFVGYHVAVGQVGRLVDQVGRLVELNPQRDLGLCVEATDSGKIITKDAS